MGGISTMLAGLLITYVIGCAFFIYVCVVADPNSSKMAQYMTQDLPQLLSRKFEQVFGKSTLEKLNQILDRALQLLYLAVVLGCWVVVFWYVYPWITESKQVSNAHKYIGYTVFLACFSSWRKACNTRPGIITAKSYERYNHYPFDNLLFVPNKKCDTTGIIRIARSKFDRLKYNQNVPRYDHFCGWVYNTIGEENYRWFLLFLGIHVIMCSYGSGVCILLFYAEIMEDKLFDLVFYDRVSGQTVKADVWIISQYMFAKRMPEAGVCLIMFVMAIALGLFFGYHVHITCKNMTTNEDGKWEDVKRWYKRQKKDYDEAVKKGWITPQTATNATLTNNGGVTTTTNNAAATPSIPDKDVTCTPSIATTAPAAVETTTSQQTIEANDNKTTIYKGPDGKQYFDPGPIPKNVYDRGLIENWKEVIYPLSLRDGEQKPQSKKTM